MERRAPSAIDQRLFVIMSENQQQKPELDESLAEAYVGKTVLLGITYENSQGQVLKRQQWFGTIRTFSNAEGIQIALHNSEEFCALMQ